MRPPQHAAYLLPIGCIIAAQNLSIPGYARGRSRVVSGFHRTVHRVFRRAGGETEIVPDTADRNAAAAPQVPGQALSSGRVHNHQLADAGPVAASIARRQ